MPLPIFGLIATIAPYLIKAGKVAAVAGEIISSMNEDGRDKPTAEEEARIDAAVLEAEEEWAHIVVEAQARRDAAT